jgi:hypothetical protein
MLRAIAFLSFLYDFGAGIALLAAADRLSILLGLPSPSPPVFADTNGLFLCAIGIGYLLPVRDPVRWRSYLWLMGPLLKGAAAVAFVVSFVRGLSPAVFLLFALSDATLAVLTLIALLQARPLPAAPTAAAPAGGNTGTAEPRQP